MLQIKPSLLSALVAAALCISSFGQVAPPSHDSPWNILVEAGKGTSRGKPVCHRLKYFSGSPFRFDYDSDLYGMNPKDVRVQTASESLGVIEGRKIVQVTQNINGGDLIMKRLLVQRQGDEFCAIYQQQYPYALVKVLPARIETVSGEPVLLTRDPNGNRAYNEAYWTFDADGPILLDLSVIDRTLKDVLPSGDEVRGDYGLKLSALCYTSIVWKNSECNACASGGTVILKLGLQNHRLVVTRKRFDPNGSADDMRCGS